ncbi:MAG: phospho-sugar mutase [Oscillospiraceae bacterium]|jgi:phosphoglucomutase|nr:phospho-sugar mutase [Oscillospiraceae bacterium]
MSQAQRAYERWYEKAPELREALAALSMEELEDQFGQSLAFGTGGLRGILGVGTGRMNEYTVAQATQGLANYLLSQELEPSVVIARDTRNKSYEFSRAAAAVLCAAGVRVYWLEAVTPVPMLSFAVRYFSASAGVVITASHNPKAYNGYKVYNADGGQITDIAAGNILAEIHNVDLFADVRRLDLGTAVEKGLLTIVPEGNEAFRNYYERIRRQVIRKDLVQLRGAELSVLYTPLYGSGNVPVRTALRESGFTKVEVVASQTQPDGNFPGLVRPNPEEANVYEKAMAQAAHLHPDLIFATDPDADRIGVLVSDGQGGYSVLTGNQTGCLLLEYILQSLRDRGELPENAAVVKTIVTSDLACKICDAYGVTLFDVLTGFKYIGEKIGQWEQSGEHSYLFGFEESYGCLNHSFARDKDAVAASVLIAEMALWHKTQGRTLYDALRAQWDSYGAAQEHLVTVPLTPAEQSARMTALRDDWQTAFADEKPTALEDYLHSERRDLRTGEKTTLRLPVSNVLKFIFADGAWLVLRPSGTEPLIKLYVHAIAGDLPAATQRAEQLLTIGKSVL